jgi:hypothetical protein
MIMGTSIRSRNSRSAYGLIAGADWRGPGHDGLAADIDQALAQHQILGAIRQYLEALAQQPLGGGGHVERVGLQGVIVADEFQLDPLGAEDLPRHHGGGVNLFRRVTAGGVGQKGNLETGEQIPEGLPADLVVPGGLTTQGNGQHGRLGCLNRLLQHFRRRIAGSAQQQPAGKGGAVKKQRVRCGRQCVHERPSRINPPPMKRGAMLGRAMQTRQWLNMAQPPATGWTISMASSGCNRVLA